MRPALHVFALPVLSIVFERGLPVVFPSGTTFALDGTL